MLNYDAKKFGANLQEHVMSVPADHGKKSAENLLQNEIARTARIETFLQRCRLKQNPQQSRFRILSVAEEHRTRKTGSGMEPMYGLDARKDPSRLKLASPPTLSWLHPPVALWRTMRFEEKREENYRHFTVHILVNPIRGVRFEVVLRIGTQPCLGDLATHHIVLPTMPLTEIFVEHFKRQMALEGNGCVADVSNPNAIGVAREMPPSLMAATTFATIPAHASGGMFIPSGRSFGSPQRPQAPKRLIPPHDPQRPRY
jgi:hypothetical protein